MFYYILKNNIIIRKLNEVKSNPYTVEKVEKQFKQVGFKIIKRYDGSENFFCIGVVK